MCGICGILNIDSESGIQEETIRKMCKVMEYRGPDDEGIYLGWKRNEQNNVGLGIRRLAIIDLKTGHQPIHNEDGTIWIVCNGEVYNFKELRKKLENEGHHFYTNSDVEVIIHLYETYGIDCLEFLRGMFAFAIWDEKKNRLFLARDRLGQKPLCYTNCRNQLIFASEIKSILQVPRIPREVNLPAIHNYLTYQYVPSPLTAFKNIRKLPPAHYLVCEMGKISIERYWNLNMNNKIKMTEDEYCKRIREVLEEAVKLRLVSDVPLGAFLSGGIDSSIIVGIMSKLMGRRVKTFSVGFEDRAYDELKYARIVAKHFKTDHHEYVVKPDAIKLLPKLIWHYNEPFADSSAIPTYYVAEKTSQEVTVALNGDGGDENFAGYPRYRAVKLAEYFEKLPLWIRKDIIDGIVKLIPYSPEQKAYGRRVRRFMKSVNYSREQRYIRWTCIFDNERKNELYTPFFKEAVEGIDSFDYLLNHFKTGLINQTTTDKGLMDQTPADKKGMGQDFLDTTLFVDIMTYLPNDLFVKMDIATMANSLEARSPFLDHKLMEFTASIPSNLKLKGFNSKYILKKAFSNLLPYQILHRGKMGFGVPVSRWLRNELKKYIYEILLSRESLQRGYFREDYLKLIVDEHCNKRYDHGSRLWALLNFELWHRMFIDRIPDANF